MMYCTVHSIALSKLIPRLNRSDEIFSRTFRVYRTVHKVTFNDSEGEGKDDDDGGGGGGGGGEDKDVG